jgi:UDP-N-acetylmuramate--alanine ligase
MSQHIHFMGIGGISMSGLARHYQAEGFRVSGCDAFDSPLLQSLHEQGIEVHVGHDPAHVAGVDLLVSTMAAPNPATRNSVAELQAASDAGIASIKRIDLLARLFRERAAVAVTGSHGKSTITGMISTVFLALADDPSIQIGANLPLIGGNMRHGTGEFLIAEVDESDPGFARLESRIAVITNLEDDHVAGQYGERRNYHASLADLESAARSFADRAGLVLRCSDSESLNRLLRNQRNSVSYGFAMMSDYQVLDVSLAAAGSSFRLRCPAGEQVSVQLGVPGRHTVQNAAAALAAAHLAGLPLDGAAAALSTYGGVGRRWQVWGNVSGALVIDDYAVHPVEVAATLAVARNTGRRVRAILQPHRWVRTALHWQALADAAACADEILVLDVFPAGESPIPGISSQLIVDRLLAGSHQASHHTIESASHYLKGSAKEGDLIITLGAGNVWQVAADLVAGAG